jgi:hypothetical protein
VFVVHELTAYWDLNYSTLVRDVGPFEQMVHSFLEIIPLMSLALLLVVAAGEGPPDWSLRTKAQPLPGNYLVAALLLVGFFNALPLMQETYSCIRARGSRKRARARVNTPGGPPQEPAIEPTLEPSRPATARTPPSPGSR